MLNDPLFFINSKNYCVYNRNIAQKIGLVSAILLSELVEKRNYHAERNELIEIKDLGSGWFFHTLESVTDRTTLSRRDQDHAIKILSDLQVIKVKAFGLPAKRHFFVNDRAVLDLLDIETLSFKKHKEKIEKNDNQLCTNRTNSAVRFVQSSHITYEPKDMNLNKTHTPLPSSSSPAQTQNRNGSVCVFSNSQNLSSRKQIFGSHVALTQESYEKFCKEYGKTFIDKLIEEMNDYCSASKPKGYLDYAAALRQWIRRRREAESKKLSTMADVRKKQYDSWIEHNGNPDEAANILRFT